MAIRKNAVRLLAVSAILALPLRRAGAQAFFYDPYFAQRLAARLKRPLSVRPFESGDVLQAENLPGVDMQSRSAMQSDFSMRGASFQDVLVLLEGRRINDPQTGHFNSDIPVTAADIGSIDVLPGAESALFGPDAIGGAVNLSLRRPERTERLLDVQGGSHRSLSGLVNVTEAADSAGLRISAEDRTSDGFREDTDFRLRTLSARPAWKADFGRLDGTFGYQEKDFGANDFYTPGLGYLSRERTRTWLADAGSEIEFGPWTLRPDLLWRRHYDRFVLDETGVRSSSVNEHRDDMAVPSLSLRREDEAWGRQGVGAEYGHEEIRSTNIGSHLRRRASVFLDQAKDLTDKASAGAAFRLDAFEGRSADPTGSLALRWKAAKRQFLRASAARSVRLPSFTELYYADPTTQGNASLSPEEAWTYEIGWSLESEAPQGGSCTGVCAADRSFANAPPVASISFFRRDEQGFIDWIRRSPSQSKWTAENVTDARVLGAECSAAWAFIPSTRLTANYAYADRNVQSEVYNYKYGVNYARHLIQTGLRWDSGVGPQSVSAAFKKKPGRPGWMSVDARASWRLLSGLTCFVEGSNILDKKYEEIEGIPQPGNWLQAGLQLEW